MPSNLVSATFKSSNDTPLGAASWRRNVVTDMKYGPDTKVTPSTICSLRIPIPVDIGPPVLFYYRLTNFYQNHRRYVKSLDTDQLRGDAVPLNTIKGGSCDPLQYNKTSNKPYYPCGLIANSVFNDSFSSPVLTNVKGSGDTNQTYNMTNKGISWSSDKELYGLTKYKPEDIEVPPNWVERWPNGYTDEHPPPNLDEDEELQVWMRTAGLPAFSKLALRNDSDPMTRGIYQIDIVSSR